MAKYREQLQAMGFGYDDVTAVAYRKINNIAFIVRVNPASKEYNVTAACRPAKDGMIDPLRTALHQFASQRQNMLKTAFFEGKQIHICYQITSDITPGVNDAVNFIMYCVNQFECTPCCSVCGRYGDVDVYSIENNVSALCTGCYGTLQNDVVENILSDSSIRMNYPMGVLGAILGGICGALIWILFSVMGRIGWMAGLVAGFGGVMGFKWLGKKISTAGIVLSIIISFIFLFMGMYIAAGIDMYNALTAEGISVTFRDALDIIPYFMQDSEYTGTLIYNNIFGIITFAATSIASAIALIKESKVKNRSVKLT